jgi:N-acetyl-anhydromuramyl-L-alanine amidase AmpD
MNIAKWLDELLSNLFGQKKEEPQENSRINPEEVNQKLNYIPFAIQHSNQMPTKGEYEDSYPVGAVIHFTAGDYKQGVKSAINSIQYGIKLDFCYLCISYDGQIIQANPLNRWGYHCGESQWPGLGKSLSRKLIGIEICCLGIVEKKDGKYKNWFNQEVSPDLVRYTPGNDNQSKGYYHIFSKEQETALIELLVWLKSNNSKVFDINYILGHDEVSGKKGLGYFRKTDPGGSLSMTMTELRAKVKQEYENRYG